MDKQHLAHKRVLLKLSGEALLGNEKFGVGLEVCQKIACSIKEMRAAGIEVALVVGGGNMFRGSHLTQLGLDRVPSDYIGMLGTIMNGIILQQALLKISCPAKVLSAFECPKLVETYHWGRAIEAISSGNVLILVGGTGAPYFTTDTAAALRASEIRADILLKATKVDGVYNKDPLKYSDAIKYSSISYAQVLAENLEIMDSTAVALCMNNKIPLFVFNMEWLGREGIVDFISSKKHGTLIKD